MRISAYIALPALAFTAAPAFAGGMQISLEIPRLRVAEYHKPYVAVWIEGPGGKVAATLDVWYDADMRGDDGRKWLPDMRTWWRRAGRSLKMPADGISGPTQGPGKYTMNFSERSKPLGKLAPGSYTLRVEAAREVGGRELVSVPFQWPPRGTRTASASGSAELGAVRLSLKP